MFNYTFNLLTEPVNQKFELFKKVGHSFFRVTFSKYMKLDFEEHTKRLMYLESF